MFVCGELKMGNASIWSADESSMCSFRLKSPNRRRSPEGAAATKLTAWQQPMQHALEDRREVFNKIQCHGQNKLLCAKWVSRLSTTGMDRPERRAWEGGDRPEPTEVGCVFEVSVGKSRSKSSLSQDHKKIRVTASNRRLQGSCRSGQSRCGWPSEGMKGNKSRNCHGDSWSQYWMTGSLLAIGQIGSLVSLVYSQHRCHLSDPWKSEEVPPTPDELLVTIHRV